MWCVCVWHSVDVCGTGDTAVWAQKTQMWGAGDRDVVAAGDVDVGRRGRALPGLWAVPARGAERSVWAGWPGSPQREDTQDALGVPRLDCHPHVHPNGVAVPVPPVAEDRGAGESASTRAPAGRWHRARGCGVRPRASAHVVVPMANVGSAMGGQRCEVPSCEFGEPPPGMPPTYVWLEKDGRWPRPQRTEGLSRGRRAGQQGCGSRDPRTPGHPRLRGPCAAQRLGRSHNGHLRTSRVADGTRGCWHSRLARSLSAS